MELTEKHAELLGLTFGDGSVTQRKGTNSIRFQLRGDATTDKVHYEEFVIPLCNELIGYAITGKQVGLVNDRKNNCSGISVESPKLKDFFETLGFPIGKKNELHIPHWIKKNKEFSKAFVRGLFDTDGSIYYKKNNTSKSKLHSVGFVTIVSTSKNLAFDTSAILKKENIKHSCIEFRKTNGEKNFFRIEVFQPHVSEFMKIIGSHNPKHLAKFQIGQKFGFCPPRTTPEQRQQILKGKLNPISLYAGVG